jgi:hypothetical protein
MSRRAALLTLVAFCFALPACVKVDRRINKENFAKIKEGMPRAEVEAILGDKYDQNPSHELAEGSGVGAAVGVVDPGMLGSSGPALKWCQWGPDHKCILVCFDRGDKVFRTKSQGLQ